MASLRIPLLLHRRWWQQHAGRILLSQAQAQAQPSSSSSSSSLLLLSSSPATAAIRRQPFPTRFQQYQPRRRFFNLPSSYSSSSSTDSSSTDSATSTTTSSTTSTGSTTTFTTTRTVPYPHRLLYEVIADIDSYHKFLPYCISSKVTKFEEREGEGEGEWRDDDHYHYGKNNNKNNNNNNSTGSGIAGVVVVPLPLPPARPRPVEAELQIGYMAFRESYTSKVHCVPHSTVIADASATELFNKLSTRWEVKSISGKGRGGGGGGEGGDINQGESSEVSLRVEFAFKSAIYQGFMGQFVGKVGEELIQAFVHRAEDLFGGDAKAKRK